MLADLRRIPTVLRPRGGCSCLTAKIRQFDLADEIVCPIEIAFPVRPAAKQGRHRGSLGPKVYTAGIPGSTMVPAEAASGDGTISVTGTPGSDGAHQEPAGMIFLV